MDNSNRKRRELIVGGLCGAGVIAGGATAFWLTRRYRGLRSKREAGLGERFDYDVERFKKTDPSLVLYEEVDGFDLGMEHCKLLAMGDDKFYIGGGPELRVFAASGEQLANVPQGRVITALHVAGDRLYLGLKDRLRVLDLDAATIADFEPLGKQTWITSIAVTDEAIYLADGGQRKILRCNREGKLLDSFGKPGEFVVPSPYFDLLVAPDGMLRVVNPGKHRIDTFSPAGEFVGAWGYASMGIEGFCGCCNPSSFTVLPDGSFVTSEKGLNRVKIYNPNGVFRGVVAGADYLVQDEVAARRACADCSEGFVMPVAAQDAKRVFVLDPALRKLRVFALSQS